MKIFALKICAFLLLFLVLSCEKEEQETPVEELWVTIGSTEEYLYDLGISGDEEFARFTVQAQHAQTSELIRNAATNYSVVYHYKPEADWRGDFAEVEAIEWAPGESAHLIKIFRFHFSITR